MKVLSDIIEPRPAILKKEIAILWRKLEREKRARLEAENLLEEKSKALFNTNTQLQQQSFRARSLAVAVEAATDGVSLTDKDGIFVYVNPAHAMIFGYSQRELIGCHRSKLHDETEWEKFSAISLDSFKRDGYWQGEANGLSKSGRLVLIHTAITQLKDGGVIATTRDISAERRISLQTKEMEERLQKAEKHAALKTLSQSVSHDVNNLLAAISGYALILQSEESLDAESRKRVIGIETAAAQAADVIQSLEDAQEAADSGYDHEQSFDLVEAIKTALRIVEALRPERVKIIADLPKCADVTGDKLLVSRCIINIVKNSLEALGGDGQITIRLSKRRSEYFKARVQRASLGNQDIIVDWVLEIVDNGIGISKHLIDRIFDPFYSTKLKGYGSGMGLQSLQTLAASQKAHIAVSSVPEQGTVFCICFAALINDLSKISNSPMTAAVANNPRAVVLVTDDNEVVGDIVTQKLTLFGYDVVYRQDAKQALSDIQHGTIRPDIVLSDMHMPSMMGDIFAKSIKAVKPGLPIIIYSGQAGYIQPHDNYFAILRKPLEPEKLKSALLDALSQQA